MDYYQHSRPQAANPQSNTHYVYPSAQICLQSSPSQSHQMYYHQQQTMQHQPMQSSYQQQQQQQQHYQPQQGSTSTSMDYNSSHTNSNMQVASGNQRTRNGGATQRTGNGHVDNSMGRFNASVNPQTEMPLRIVIDAKHVGAIIGTGGNNIREITKESKARVVVDSHRVVKDQQGHLEKVINIMGPPESCSKACAKIVEVVHGEVVKEEHSDHPEVELKIRAHNQLVGRLIGKQGATIKKIMQETETTIFVSNEAASRAASMQPYGALPNIPEVVMNLERTITVKGPTIDTVSQAEQKISSKLRQSYETDMQNRLPIGGLTGAMQGLVLPPDHFNPRPFPGAYGAAGNQTTKVTKMWVPNSMVGAIIGTRGSNIRNIMRNSGANIRIEGGDKREKNGEDQPESDKEDNKKEETETTETPAAATTTEDNKPPTDDKKDDERLIIISGNDEQQYKAQFYIFQRVADQSMHYFEECRLRTEVTVPSRLVGRIIGKGGQNVRELQRITGAVVKIPEDEMKEENGHTDEAPTHTEGAPASNDEGTVVRIIGSFQASQSVQFRIGQLIADFNRTSLLDKRREEGHDNIRKSSPPAAPAAVVTNGNASD